MVNLMGILEKIILAMYPCTAICLAVCALLATCGIHIPTVITFISLMLSAGMFINEWVKIIAKRINDKN